MLLTTPESELQNSKKKRGFTNGAEFTVFCTHPSCLRGAETEHNAIAYLCRYFWQTTKSWSKIWKTYDAAVEQMLKTGANRWVSVPECLFFSSFCNVSGCARFERTHLFFRQIAHLSIETMCQTMDEVHMLDILNAVMSVLIVVIAVKLTYDWYNYRKTNQIPWIARRMPWKPSRTLFFLHVWKTRISRKIGAFLCLCDAFSSSPV